LKYVLFTLCNSLKNPWNSQNKISIDTDLLIMINLITNNTLVLLEVYFINLNLFFSFVIQNLIDITWIQFKVWGGGGPIRLIITFFGWLPFKEKKKSFWIAWNVGRPFSVQLAWTKIQELKHTLQIGRTIKPRFESWSPG
jgi:hypothetical protein